VIDKTNYKMQEAEADCKELYIEPASYILNDDSHSFLPPSKALMLGLLPLVSVGVFSSGAFDDGSIPETHYETHKLVLPLPITASLVTTSVVEGILATVPSAETSRNILNVAYKKTIIGAQGFQKPLFNEAVEHKHKALTIKNVLAKEVSIVIKKPPLLRKMEQQRVHLQQKTVLANVKVRQKKKVTFLASKASTVRLVSSKPSKKLMPMGILNIRSRLINEKGRVVKASYFVIQQGKRIKQQEKAQSAVFKLPVGEYIIQAVYNGKVMQKKAVVEKAHVDQLTFIYPVKKQSNRNSVVASISANRVEKKTVSTGKIVVMSHDERGRGKVLAADYFVYKNGQEVLYKSHSSVTNFQLPVGDYVLRAVRSSDKGRAVIREMAIVVKSDSVIFPIFVFGKNDAILKKEGKEIQGDDLNVIAKLVLHNEGDHQYVSSGSLELTRKQSLPMGIGFSHKKL
jgi:hypothetical protein